MVDFTINILFLDVSPRILTAVDCKNNDIRKNRDWEKQKGRAVV